MKKKLLVLGLVFAGITGVNAQTVLLNEGFEDVENWTPEQVWDLYDLDGDGDFWGLIPPNDNTILNEFTGTVIGSFSYDNGTETPLRPDNLLVTPSLTLLSGASELSFKVGAIDPDFFAEYYTTYAVLKSEFDAALELGTIGDITTFLGSKTPLVSQKVAQAKATVKTFTLDPAFANKEIVVLFRHHNSFDVFSIIVDDVKVVSNGNASINKELASQFSVFPNPANDIVNFTNSGNILVSKIEVKDLNGRNVQSFDFNGVATSEINISQLQAGVYFLNITTNEGTLTKKIIKK
ncbi:T9SS type A sorting domain-containing protein [Flavobacterium sp. JP2137]|uniref:T9SS type A sorting domain-containing protein n=1 Tax=Flavobacterium sp. JP2137 TaxID=3414510 RepID=UPI003D2FC208